MKTNRLITTALLALFGLALASFVPRTFASVLTTTYVNTFDLGSQTSDFSGTGSVASWLYWYGVGYNNTAVTNDITMDAEGNSSSGSLMVYIPFGTNGDQCVIFGSFDNEYGYDNSETASGLLFTNITFKIHVAPGTPLNSSGNFGMIQPGLVGSGWQNGGAFYGSGLTIPASATNGWVTLSQTVDYTDPYVTSVAGFDFKYTSYSGYPKFPITFWIDDVTLNLNPAPPPPPPIIASQLPVPVSGLNSFAVNTSDYQRYHVCTLNDTGYSFIGRPSVTYSWTIRQFPTSSDWSQNIFLLNGEPGIYDTAADYNLADCVFITIQSQGPGMPATFNFRYKTNEPSGQSMFFNTNLPTLANSMPTYTTNTNTMVITTNAAVNPYFWPVMPFANLVDPAGPLGTWSITFSGDTNVTMTSPSGLTTNFVFDPASAALFADPMSICVGGQFNSTGAGQTLVVSNFSITGSVMPINDNFATDTKLDTTVWKNQSNNTNGCVLVPPTSAFWLTWTLPDAGFGLQTTGHLPATSWTALPSVLTIQNNGARQALVDNSNLQGTNQGYFSLVERAFSQLQVLLPGETAAPGTPTGKTGTPTPIDLSTNFGLMTFTVNAVDSQFNVIAGNTDTIMITSSDGAAITPNNAALANGTGQFTIELQTPGSQTVTATDVSNTNIPPAMSASVTTSN